MWRPHHLISYPQQRTALSFISVLFLTVCSLSYFGAKNEAQIHRRLLNSLTEFTDPKSTALRTNAPLDSQLISHITLDQQLLDHESNPIVSTELQALSTSSPNTFSFSMFPSVDHMFVDQRLSEITAHHPKEMVVVFIDNTYLETFGVWLDHYKQHDNSGRILSICAVSEMAYEKIAVAFSSPEMQEKLTNVGETLLVNINPGKDIRSDNADHFLDELWVVRLRIMRRIINTFSNVNVLYTDADAIWLKDPAQLYNHPQHLSSNIVASRGTYPEHCPLGKELHNDPNNPRLNTVTICMGFTYFRNSPDVRQLAQNLENAVSKYKNDDQVAINCILNLQYGSNDDVNINDPSSMADFTQEDKTIIRSFFGKVVAHNIKVSLLSYEQVTRRCDRDDGMLENTVVAHCYTAQKEGESKIHAFEKFGFLIEGENSFRHAFNYSELDIARFVSSTARGTGASWEEAAYSLSLDRFWRHIDAVTSQGASTDNSYYPDLKSQHQSTIGLRSTRLLNSVRIPKSGSSALSVTARALAGCHPDGYPCCMFPGDPVGSCPRKDLMCPLVTGCTDHRPDYNGDEAVITTLRDPVSRSVSAFFYHYPHTSVKHGEPHTWEKFVENVQSPRYRNILTKMLNGAYAYDDFDELKHTAPRAKARLCSIAWFGLSEMPVSSSVMLYETPQFRRLLPNPVAFGLPASGATAENVAEETGALRVNSDSEYKEFLATSFANNDGASIVMTHNQQDVELFQFAEKLFCGRLFSFPGLVGEMKQKGIGLEETERCASIGFGNIEQLCDNNTE